MNDYQIRNALKPILINKYANNTNTLIIEELGISHGEIRIDLAVINGFLHGYELKSDKDTLYRLPEQAKAYNLVFDKMTLVVGKRHAYEAIKIIPDWWGIKIVDKDCKGQLKFYPIRHSGNNPNLDPIAILELLWKEEALNFLEELDNIKGFRSKKRNEIYKRIAEVSTLKMIKSKVSSLIRSRSGWRFGLQPMLNDDLYLP